MDSAFTSRATYVWSRKTRFRGNRNGKMETGSLTQTGTKALPPSPFDKGQNTVSASCFATRGRLAADSRRKAKSACVCLETSAEKSWDNAQSHLARRQLSRCPEGVPAAAPSFGPFLVSLSGWVQLTYSS